MGRNVFQIVCYNSRRLLIVIEDQIIKDFSVDLSNSLLRCHALYDNYFVQIVVNGYDIYKINPNNTISIYQHVGDHNVNDDYKYISYDENGLFQVIGGFGNLYSIELGKDGKFFLGKPRMMKFNHTLLSSFEDVKHELTRLIPSIGLLIDFVPIIHAYLKTEICAYMNKS